MSSQLLFPYIRPLNDPPPRWNAIHRGHRTPSYALAWMCPARRFSTRITEAKMGLDVSNVGDEVLKKWIQKYDFPRTQRPIICVGGDGEFYLCAMFNRREFGDYATRAQNPDDELIVAARESMFVTEELEPMFKWYRYPMGWAEYHPDLDKDD